MLVGRDGGGRPDVGGGGAEGRHGEGEGGGGSSPLDVEARRRERLRHSALECECRRQVVEGHHGGGQKVHIISIYCFVFFSRK